MYEQPAWLGDTSPYGDGAAAYADPSAPADGEVANDYGVGVLPESAAVQDASPEALGYDAFASNQVSAAAAA